MPAQVVVPGQVDEPTEDPRSASVTLMARRSAQAFLEARVANPVRSALEELPVAVRAAEATLVDAVRLVAFELEQAAAVGRDGADEQEAEEAGTLALGGLLEERIRRLEEAERSLSDAVSEWERVWMDASTEALTELRDVVLGRGEPGAVAGRFSWLHVVERAAERVQTAGRTLALKARRAASRAPPTTEPSTIVEELLLLRQRLSPDPGLQAKLPLLYRRMFGRAALETPDLVVGRVHELARLAGLVERWRSGSPGPIGIIGDPRCGRTTFANTWMRSQERPVIRVPPPTSGTVEELNAAVARAAGARDGQSAEGALRGLAPGAVVYVDELGGWLERSPGGLSAARAWFRLFRRLSDRHLFLVTGNSFAFELGEAALGIDPLFAGTVTLGPLAPSDLEALLLLRQRTSDFELEFVSRRRLGGDRPGAQLERLHRQSFGNPGEALDLWRRSIVDVTEQRIKLYVSQAPDTGVLALLPEAWCAALSTIVLHRSVNAARLARTLRIGRDEAQSLLGDLGRAKLVRSERTGVWDLDPILQGPVTRALRGRGFVP